MCVCVCGGGGGGGGGVGILGIAYSINEPQINCFGRCHGKVKDSLQQFHNTETGPISADSEYSLRQCEQVYFSVTDLEKPLLAKTINK